MFNIIIYDFIAVAIRWWVWYVGQKFVDDRVEVNTPINSWKRLQEGLALYENGVSPYDGDTCHSPPFVLFAFFYAKNLHPFLPQLTFVLCDIIGANCLMLAARHFAWNDALVKKIRMKNVVPAKMRESLFVTREQVLHIPRLVKICYLFNPFGVVSCVAQTTSTVHNAVLAASFLFMIKGRTIECLCLLAFSTYMEFYPSILLVPTLLYISSKVFTGDKEALTVDRRKQSIFFLAHVFVFALFVVGLFYASFLYTGSWKFFDNSIGFIVSAPDLTPNVGLFWYFFTEMFEHFRLFFLFVFIFNPFIYVLPLSFRLRNEPVLLYIILYVIMTVFKSYPCLGDTVVYFSLLPLYYPVIEKHTRYGFVIGCSVAVFSVLAPVMWHLWIETGSANANFYFAITLVYSVSQIFLITDLLSAFLIRELSLQHGLKPKIEGKQAVVVLDGELTTSVPQSDFSKGS